MRSIDAEDDENVDEDDEEEEEEWDDKRRMRTICTSRATTTTTRSRSVFLMVASTRVGVGGGHPGGHGRAHLIIGLVCSRGQRYM